MSPSPSLFSLDLLLDSLPISSAEIAHSRLPFSPIPYTAQPQYLLRSIPVLADTDEPALVVPLKVDLRSRQSRKQAVLGGTVLSPIEEGLQVFEACIERAGSDEGRGGAICCGGYEEVYRETGVREGSGEIGGSGRVAPGREEGFDVSLPNAIGAETEPGCDEDLPVYLFSGQEPKRDFAKLIGRVAGARKFQLRGGECELGRGSAHIEETESGGVMRDVDWSNRVLRGRGWWFGERSER